MTRLLAVSGASGYLGRAILAAIASVGDSRIRVLSRGSDAIDLADEVVRGSILETPAIERLVDGADAVIHAAGLVRSKDRAALHDTNVAGTRRLLDSARRLGVRRVVHVSSTGVYGHPGHAVDESSPRHPIGLYEESKAVAERLALAATVPTVVIQPSNVIGPDHPLRPLRRFLAAVRSGRPLLHAGAWTNYVGVAHVARVIVEAATTRDVPSVLIVNAPMPLSQFASVAGATVGRPPWVVALPAPLGRFLLPPLSAAAARAGSIERLRALVDQTRFCTLHERWFQDRDLSPTLDEPLSEMAEEYGFR